MKRKNFIWRTIFIFTVSIFFVYGCTQSGSDQTTEEAVTDTVDSTRAEAGLPQKLADPEIASIAVTANQVDIDYAQLALEKSGNDEVKKFASSMIKDHQSVIDQAKELVEKLGVTPQENSTTQSLLDGAGEIHKQLNAKFGDEFDKAYIDNEVEFHEAAITLVEKRLIPETTNKDLQAFLMTALPVFKGHLEHARQLQGKLPK